MTRTRIALLALLLCTLGCPSEPVVANDDDDATANDDDATANDDDATANDDDATANDDDATANDDDATANDDDATANDDDSGDDDDSSGDGVCMGDALLSDIPISTDFSDFEDRWNENSELTRILFLGEPF